MLELTIAALVAKGFKVFTRPYELNILGVRNNSSVPNVFDDTINVLYKDDAGRWQDHSYRVTTDPGLYWLTNPLNVDGTAILKTGQYLNSHMIGLHRGKYTALVQRGPVTVIRDANRDKTVDFSGKEDTGLFGINIHRAMEQGTTTSVDRFSAGCQVFANANDFSAFLALCEKHKQLYGNLFSYTLVNQAPVFNL